MIGSYSHKMVVARELERAWSNGGHGAREELYSPGFVLHHVQAGDLYLPRFQQLLAGMRAANENLRMVWHGTIAEGDYIVVPYFLSGIFNRDFTVLGIKATDKPWAVNGYMLYRMEGDLITEAWAFYDTMSMALQWGKVSGVGLAAPESPWDIALSNGPATSHHAKAFIERYLDTLSGHQKSRDLLEQFIGDEDSNLQAHILATEAAFPCYELEPQIMAAESVLVFALLQFRGEHGGDFMGIPPLGREVVGSAAIMYRVAQEKIVAHWMVTDSPSVMRRITDELPYVPI